MSFATALHQCTLPSFYGITTAQYFSSASERYANIIKDVLQARSGVDTAYLIEETGLSRSQVSQGLSELSSLGLAGFKWEQDLRHRNVKRWSLK